MSLFESVTHTSARDCVEDERQKRIIFVVNNGKMGSAIGKGGCYIKSLQNKIKKNIELVEFHDDPVEFLRNTLKGDMISEIKLNKRPDGAMQAIVIVEAGKKGIVVGREGRNAEKVRLLAKRYFGINSVLINSPERTALEI